MVPLMYGKEHGLLKERMPDMLKFTKVPYLIDSRNTDGTWLRGIGFDNGCTMS